MQVESHLVKMLKYQLISKDASITEYIEEMAQWIYKHSGYSQEDVSELFYKHRQDLNELFESSLESIFHDDPAKWAEMLAIYT